MTPFAVELMPWTIYCHIHIESGRRYVGLTSQTMMQRWNQHVHKSTSSKGGRWHFPNAIRKYGKGAFFHEILEICDTLEAANTAEEKWINHFDSRNHEKGFNIIKGGLHKPIRNDIEFRERLSSAVRNSLTRPEVQERRSQASRKVWSDPQFKIKMSEISRSALSNPEVRRKISSAIKGTVHSAEHREKNSRAHRGLSRTDSWREKMSITMENKWSNPEWRNKQIKIIKNTWDTERRIQLAEYNRRRTHSPETKAKISKALKSK